MLQYTLRHFEIKIKITYTIINSFKNVYISYVKVTIINKFLNKLQMLYYDRIDIFEGTGVNKTS